MAKFKRRQYLIDKKLQLKYVVMTIGLLLIYTFLFAAILFIPHILDLSSGNTLEEQTRAARVLLNLHASVWPALGIVITFLSLVSIFITHKIAGPVYRFKKVLAEVSTGNLNISIKLRKGDDLHDLADDMNVVIDELRSFVVTLKDDHTTMQACIDELEATIRQNQINSETGQSLIGKLKSSSERTSEALKKYLG